MRTIFKLWENSDDVRVSIKKDGGEMVVLYGSFVFQRGDRVLTNGDVGVKKVVFTPHRANQSLCKTRNFIGHSP